jgi:hypothetical protein
MVRLGSHRDEIVEHPAYRAVPHNFLEGAAWHRN